MHDRLLSVVVVSAPARSLRRGGPGSALIPGLLHRSRGWDSNPRSRAHEAREDSRSSTAQRVGTVPWTRPFRARLGNSPLDTAVWDMTRGPSPNMSSSVAAAYPALHPTSGLGARCSGRTRRRRLSYDVLITPALVRERSCLCHSPALRPWIGGCSSAAAESVVLRGGALEPGASALSEKQQAKAEAGFVRDFPASSAEGPFSLRRGLK